MHHMADNNKLTDDITTVFQKLSFVVLCAPGGKKGKDVVSKDE